MRGSRQWLTVLDDIGHTTKNSKRIAGGIFRGDSRVLAASARLRRSSGGSVPGVAISIVLDSTSLRSKNFAIHGATVVNG
jgi:hypothetical protein